MDSSTLKYTSFAAKMGSIDEHPDPTSFLSQRYTHLIIGGGTAGLVVAARLSENPDITVGVLEAGSAAFDEQKINVPGRLGETLGSTMIGSSNLHRSLD